MTHSGGMPHEVGDRGQRFEVSFYDPELGQRRTLGWTNSAEDAMRMGDAVDAHPSWQFPQILDRHANAKA